MKRSALLLFLGACSLLGGAAATMLLARGLPSAVGQPGPSELDRISDRFQLVVKRVAPSVVAIEAIKPPQRDNPKSKAVEESGSGILVRWPKYKGTFVITNNHVIQAATANQITVSLADSRVIRPTRVWTDPESDIALLLLDGENLPTVPLGDSDTARVGQWVLAFGSPFGLNQTVTHGIVSARERSEVSLGSTIRIKEFLQTDAAINPGSSGGPLVNLDGEVIGVNTAIASNSGNASGVAFSIPINLVRRISEQLLEKGSVTRGYLGLQLAKSFEAADALKMGLDRAQGALVERVYVDTPAAQAGLRPGDVVLEVDRVAIRNDNHFISLISGLPVGQRVRLRVWRDRGAADLEAVVGDWSRGQSQLRPGP
jgi:S1-C subfamily serine protease